MGNLESGLPEEIAEDEDLARFLTQSSHFNTTQVKPAAFLPSPRDHETSVCRHGKAPAKDLWNLGTAAAGERTLYGAAILKASEIRSAQLEVFPDEPPPLHAAIRNWPWIDNDPDMQKAQQKELAILLASAAGSPFLK